MSYPVSSQPGRVDQLAKTLFTRLLNRYGNPQLRFACKLAEKEIGECLEENLGPGTKVHTVGSRVIGAMNEIGRRFE